MAVIADRDEVVTLLREGGKVLWAPPPVPEAVDRSIPAANPGTNQYELFVSRPHGAGIWDEDRAGLIGVESGIVVSAEVYEQLCAEIKDSNSLIRRHSNRAITRAFVFVDVSDFSKMPAGIQLLVVLALVQLSRGAPVKLTQPEAALCIGDGYIYVFEDPVNATLFAADLANRIEMATATRAVPEFHFRTGVHVGEVRCFWDPGRNNWNYVGDGINGAQRVLSAIGKETDDVVFVSADVRQAVLTDPTMTWLLAALDNKGRKLDKHGNPWRVYQLHHSAVVST